MEFNTDVFSVFDKKWALVTAGTATNFNTMTISWGGLGTLWNKPVATVYVRASRYTHDFMDANEYFTISFYSEEYRKVLGVLGSKSGREMDKMRESGLTPVLVDNSISFKEAKLTFVCRKLFRQQLNLENMPEDVIREMYTGQALHDMYIGEVTAVIGGEES